MALADHIANLHMKKKLHLKGRSKADAAMSKVKTKKKSSY